MSTLRTFVVMVDGTGQTSNVLSMKEAQIRLNAPYFKGEVLLELIPVKTTEIPEVTYKKEIV